MNLKHFLISILLWSGIEGSAYAQVAQLPFEFHGTHLSIKVKSRGSDNLNFIFDSGSTGANIDSAVAERIGISKENRQTVNVAGSGGSANYSMALHENLTIGGAALNNINLVVVDFASLSAETGMKIDGIIGYEILNKYVTAIDFDHKMLRLYEQIGNADTTGYTGIPFEFSKNIMIPRFPVSVQLANGESFTGRVMFDTGNAFSLIVSTPFSKFHNFNGKLGETSFTGGRGFSAVTRDQLANINAMSFNGFRFGRMGIRLTVNERAEPRDGYLGILGIEIIKRFNVIMDYAHKKIYLKPNQAYHDPLKLETIVPDLSAASAAFLEANRKKAGVQVTASGLQYKIIKRGSGKVAAADDRVSMHYTTRLFNGTKLWSTRDSGKPWVHHLDKALAGMREAALLLPAGTTCVLYIPPALAFGDAGYEEVPGGAALICELEILAAEH